MYIYHINRYTPLFFSTDYPSFISVEVSNKCNLNCPECAVGNKLTNTKRNSLDIDTYKTVLEEIGDKLITAIFYFQGEPLLNRDIDLYIREAKKYNIFTQTSTNGQITNDTILNKLVDSGLDKIIVSIDGTTEQTYQKYRKGGKLSKTIEFIEKLNKIKKEKNSKLPLIETQMIVFRHNENEINDFKKKSKEWGADYYTIKTAYISENNRKDLAPLNKKYSRYKYDRKSDKWINKNKNSSICFRAVSGAVINSDGDILPCCFDKISEYEYGTLNNENKSFLEIWRSQQAYNFRKLIKMKRDSINICTECNE